MSINPNLIRAIRFGYGLRPGDDLPGGPEDMLAALRGPDRSAADWPIAGFDLRGDEARILGDMRKARREKQPGAEAAYKTAANHARDLALGDFRRSIIRAVTAKDMFRERLVRFWADHFAISAKGKGLATVTTSYVEDAIRPHVTGRFSDLLKAAVLHPVMLIYLDQILSIGPNSTIGKARDRGLNENLAREILELHTLGVGGAYTQKDVRQFAELLTGLFYNFRTGFKFRTRAAEPGAEEVLGQLYGGARAGLEDINAALDDLALHPDTARHIARKLAVHFVADEPEEPLVAALAGAYTASQGDLLVVYEALLTHPLAQRLPLQKVKQPFDFIATSLRALAVDPQRLDQMSRRDTRTQLLLPMQVMGQAWEAPPGPDGWPEAQEDWVTAQGLAARVQWALLAAGLFAGDKEPSTFARTALGDLAPTSLVRTVGFAESRLEGVALVLASPEFNRR